MRQPRPQTTKTVAKLFDGRLRLERRTGNPNLYARTFIQRKLIGKSTHERTLGAAKKAASAWYTTLLAKAALGESIHARSFDEAAVAFLTYQDEIAQVSDGQRRNYHQKWSLLKNDLTGVRLNEIDLHFLEGLRERRAAVTTRTGTTVTPSTLKKDLIFIRLVLRHAVERERWLDRLPAFPSFEGRRFKIVPNPRAFFTPDELTMIEQQALLRAVEEGITPSVQAQRMELYYFITLCVSACLRVGEAHSLRFRDCSIVEMPLDKKARRVLVLKVLGKHSPNGRVREDAYGFFGAAEAFEQLRASRPNATPDDKVFLHHHRDGFRALLTACGLRETADGKKRDLKSLRPSGISWRLDTGPDNTPDYRAIAKYARTSPEMIAKFYDQTRAETLLGKVADYGHFDKMAKLVKDLAKKRRGRKVRQRARNSSL